MNQNVDDLAMEAWDEYRRIYDENYSHDESIFVDGFRAGYFAATQGIEKGITKKLPTETLDGLLRMTERNP